MKKYPTYNQLNLSQISKDILDYWKEKDTFGKSISTREGKTPWVFYEGPPSANGMPGIHHVMARTIKDIFCRYKTLQGFQVKRKAGWDTHGLPIELGVEKSLGITKEDIGNPNSKKFISVEDYNKACRKEVMKYTDKWEDVTAKMGYWVDMKDPYITYDNKYIESVWWLLQNMNNKGLLYKGFTIQPYSPAAGTGLSSHELNQPGCYRDVKDRTAVAMFQITKKVSLDFPNNSELTNLIDVDKANTYFLAWTTTPWTLPSNTALAVGKDIDYVLVRTFNPLSQKPISVILAKDLMKNFFSTNPEWRSSAQYVSGWLDSGQIEQTFQNFINQGGNAISEEFENFFKAKKIPSKVICEFKGEAIRGWGYKQLLDFGVKLEGDNFRVVTDSFVTTTDGTGIVHIAPTFGAEDYRVAKETNISPFVTTPIMAQFDSILEKVKPSYDEFYTFTGATASTNTMSLHVSTDKGQQISWNDLGNLSWNDLSGATWSNIVNVLKSDQTLTAKTLEKYEEERKIIYQNKDLESLEKGEKIPLVDKRGRFLSFVKDGVFLYGEEYVKEAYHTDAEKQVEFEKQKQILEASGKIKELKAYLSVDERIVLKLQEEGKLFKKETYEHSYPHCWRTDKPVLYYPLDSWFIKSTAAKDRMIELNKTINWKPEATGTGRFGNWLENLNDWNLSRSRFWGIPIPIWTSEDKNEQVVIGSAEELKTQIENSIAKGFMTENPLGKFVPGNFTAENYDTFDLHKPYADNIVLEKNGKKLFREPDLIDVWFDSGAMPYAQVHYPFENKELIDDKKYYPADFIAEGVDQTRGWFFTLHAIATMNFDSVAYKNVVSNGLVLDKNGNKMSKRLGNAVDPFETIEKYGADATRWYMIANAAPWDNLKFDVEGIGEVQRKLFGTLYNTYGFFALYANVDGFVVDLNNTVNVSNRSELDRWILSKLNSLVKDVTEQYETFEPHKAARYIEEFVDEHLSNWYIRLSRRRFWKGDMSDDKKAAYETLFECLNTLSQLMSPIAPFFADWLYQNLNDVSGDVNSVHLTNYPKVDLSIIDSNLEKRMEMAQKISSMILSIRKKENLRVRQPLQKIRIPILDSEFRQHVEAVKDIILAEVNVKELEFVTEEEAHIVKNLKLNFKTLGKKCGKHMKTVQAYANDHGDLIIAGIEKTGQFKMNVEGEEIVLEGEDVEIIPVDIPGWKVANSGQITVALDVTLSDSLKEEGLARELVNRIQNMRKDSGLDVTDKILVKIQQNAALDTAIQNNLKYICAETLTGDLQVVQNLSAATASSVEVDELVSTLISIEKLN